MNENELKSIERYFNKFNEDAASFNEFEANDFIKLLKNNGRNDDAIEVGNTFLQMAPSLKGYINQYGYALDTLEVTLVKTDDLKENVKLCLKLVPNEYFQGTMQEYEKIKEKESLFFDILEDILGICKQEKYSPVEPAINRAIKYALNQTPINYDLMIKMLNKLDVRLLSDKPFVNNEGREFESFKERYFRLKVRALFETKQYKACVECANQALATPLKWHYNALQWIKYYRGCALLELKEYDEANREFISLHNRIKGVNFYEVLYKTNATVGKVKEANAYLLYEFFENGYALEQLPLYQRLNEAVENSGNELLIKVVHSFIKALCNENQKECDFTIDEKYQGKDSSSLYDEMYDLIMSHLDSLVTRKSGKVVYYNEQNQFGNISVYDHDPIFFRQADFAYDEEVERNIRVNYTVLPTYDSKKQRLTEKAILVTIDDSDYDFINR